MVSGCHTVFRKVFTLCTSERVCLGRGDGGVGRRAEPAPLPWCGPGGPTGAGSETVTSEAVPSPRPQAWLFTVKWKQSGTFEDFQ